MTFAPPATTAPESLQAILADRTLLDLEEARCELERLGLHATRYQVARWAAKRELPFFQFGKKLVIQRGELHATLQKRQLAAIRGDDKRQSGRRRRSA